MHTSMSESGLFVSWDQFQRDSRTLARMLKAKGPFRAIIAITRGGLVPAAIIARELNIRLVETLCISSYDENNRRGELHVLKKALTGPSDSADASDILVIDDLVDTGATVKLVRTMFPNAHFATVYSKPMGRPMADSCVTEVSQDTWIYFPWDTELAVAPAIIDRDD